ncbi:MAG: hypothetical protein KJ795_12085 [Gammaproteobacteria bacterium]|nr:hypothetical protein [Gammaproteobacteria bacterium]MBU1775983.1 hypothetical protein [Gammaproteobacteria bacterium]MBU1968755.1 hypothetical protein [Gammaproteobacteria bacterium]
MLSASTLEQIASAAASIGALNDATLDSLKKNWPDLRFTFCNDDDMPARLSPALRGEGFNVYLVGGGEHCLSLTQDIGQAIGVVLAQVEED